jgi:uncharacterized protein YggT (Ycf19 family)
MAIRQDDPVHRDGHTERIERVEHFHEGTAASPTPATNVNAGPAAAPNDVVTAFTRVVLLVFSTLEVLLLLRFVFKLSGANAGQPLMAELYGFTDIFVRPFQGIFPEPRGVGTVVDLAALLATLFLFLVGLLIVALVRAIAGRTV